MNHSPDNVDPDDDFDDESGPVVVYINDAGEEITAPLIEAEEFGPDDQNEFQEFKTDSNEIDSSEDDSDPADDEPSKSQRKRDAHALLDLGKQLVLLSPSELETIPLESKLEDAILLARSITANGGKKRQLHYIGKLMRYTDPGPIQTALEKLRVSANDEKRRFHRLEEWRTDLLENEKDALTEFKNEYPNCDIQQLRQLLRNCRQEEKKGKPPKAFREIFKWLREVTDD